MAYIIIVTLFIVLSYCYAVLTVYCQTIKNVEIRLNPISNTVIILENPI